MQPRDRPVFFVDRCLGGRVIPAALREAGEMAVAHDDEFDQNTDDEDWLPVVGRRGWIVVTRDNKIRDNPLELAAVYRHRVALFCVPPRGAGGSSLGALLVSALTGIRIVVQRKPKPFVARVTPSGAVAMMFDEAAILRRLHDRGVR